MTSLEKRALLGLIIGAIWAAAFLSVFFVFAGVETYLDSPRLIRTILAAIVVVGSVVYIIFYIFYRKSAKFDERDRLILIRAADLQLAGVILAVGSWSVALSQIYKDVGQVPVTYFYLIVVTMVMVSTIMQSIGILFWSRHTEYISKV